MNKHTTLQEFFLSLKSPKAHTNIIYHKEFNSKKIPIKKLIDISAQVAKYFSDHKIKSGDTILLCGPNSPEWLSVYFACALTGVILIPLDISSTHEFISTVMEKTKPKHLFISKYKIVDKLNIDQTYLEYLFEDISSLEPIQKFPNLKQTDTFQIVFTSGTTSAPKGVILTHKNLISALKGITHLVPKKDRYGVLSILPLSHIYEQTIGLLLPLYVGANIVYPVSRRPSILIDSLQTHNINVVVSVPAFLGLLQNKIERFISQSPKKQQLFETITKLIAPLPLPLKQLIGYQLITKKIGPLEIFISGGSALDIETEKFWEKIGVRVIQGYGMTEASPLLTSNSYFETRVGSVGKALPSVNLKLGDQNEILAKGDIITPGYFKNQEATKNTIVNDWLRTGDIGEFDADGYLFLKGRLKNMILTDSGMNIYPEDIEAIGLKINSIKDICVVGIEIDKKIQTVAVVLPKISKFNPEFFKQLLNKQLASHQQVNSVIVWPLEDFPRTHTHKIKRNLVIEQLKDIKTKKVNQVSNDKLFQVLQKVKQNTNHKIKETSLLYNDLGIDSMARLELITAIEEEFGVFIEETAISYQTKVKDLRKIIKQAKAFTPNNSLHYLNVNKFITAPRRLLQALSLFGFKKYAKLKIEGKSNLKLIDPDKPVIYIANHTSNLDSLFVLKALPWSVRKKLAIAAAKDFVFESVVWRANMFRVIFNAFPLSRDNQAYETLKQFGKFIDAGFGILIFPEGSRSPDGKLLPFKTGIGLMALSLEAQIVPIYLEGAYEMLPKHETKIKPGKGRVVIDKPYSLSTRLTPLKASRIIQQNFEQLIATQSKTN